MSVTGTVPTANTVTTNAQPNITSVGTLTSLDVTGNTTSSNFIGNLANGTSNISIPAANGNIQVSVAGVANIVTFASNNAFRGSYGLNGSVYQANTAPANPQPGDQWYNTFNGILFEYLNDGDTLQWVDVSSIPLPSVSAIAAGKQTIYIPAQSIVPRATTGAAPGSFQSFNFLTNTLSLDFDSIIQEFGQFQIGMPKSWDEGTVTYDVIWSYSTNTTVNFGVVWSLAGVALSDGNSIDTAFGTAVLVTDTGGATNAVYDSPESSAVTIGNVPAENDLVIFQVSRVTSDVNDTLAVDARLLGIRLYYTVVSGNDA